VFEHVRLPGRTLAILSRRRKNGPWDLVCGGSTGGVERRRSDIEEPDKARGNE